MFTSQAGNTAEGDIVAGNQTKTVNVYRYSSPLGRLYEKFRLASEGQPHIAEISEQLQHYCTVDTDGDVRGLEEKLTAANRADLLRQASKLKESAAKTIMKWQTSGVAQDILTYILGQLYSAFMLNVVPAIEAGKDRAEVDAIISEKVIAPTADMLGDNDLMLTPADILGLLFFLGGNCHIRWDKC
ncbi:hypothetical protein N5J23_13420 [Comamonas aquatica]|uniref:ABC-three component systems C-terminal domain-containing protein n=1 Tax=Comamonas aquatica TaxID=225991 RepID=A0AA42W3A6_9BURK|nr:MULTISPECIES: ABC-three component system protein [Comamonas]MDH0373072.1 hypothetical protein [Comamonas aquatica]MDH1428472.1 hypothetical protein [Comamonas aquatica]MDH1606763.1 hypothetical protein [Comamonas aquatica]MDH1618507.1 hypothetical protein [Comamonas aquatica]MDH1766144.1 hypothetical protein [Comamonas aquatica]